jgi:hypothetical protein
MGNGELSELVIPPELTSVEFGAVWQGKWTTKGDFISGADTAFNGCGKLPIKTRQTIQGWGYKGKF